MSNTNGDTREALAAKLRGYIGQVEFARRQYVLLTPDEAKAILAALTEQPAPQAEPVAYIEHHKGGDNLVWEAQKSSPRCTPLYTHPAAAPQGVQAEPLTLEEIRQCYDVAHGRGPNFVGKLSPFSIAVARAIEAAHGIGAAPAAPAQERAQAEPTCLHSAATILTVAADAVIRAYRAKYRNTSRGGFNARAPLYAEIADLNAALVGMGGLDNRGELLRHAAPAQEPQQPARGTRMPPASIGASDEWEA